MRPVPVQARNGEIVLINPDQVRGEMVMGAGSKIEFGPAAQRPSNGSLLD